MSFDVFLACFNNGESADGDRDGVAEVLSRHRVTGPDEFGFYVISFSDDIRVEFSARGLDGSDRFSGAALHIRSLGEELTRFLFDVAKQGRFFILPAMEGGVPIVVDEELAFHIPDDIREGYGEPIFIPSHEELHRFLLRGWGDWADFAAQVRIS